LPLRQPLPAVAAQTVAAQGAPVAYDPVRYRTRFWQMFSDSPIEDGLVYDPAPLRGESSSVAQTAFLKSTGSCAAPGGT